MHMLDGVSCYIQSLVRDRENGLLNLDGYTTTT